MNLVFNPELQNNPALMQEEFQHVIQHEFGHAVGLIHEHQRPDRPIKWNEDVLLQYFGGPPNNWWLDQIGRTNRVDLRRRFAGRDGLRSAVDHDVLVSRRAHNLQRRVGLPVVEQHGTVGDGQGVGQHALPGGRRHRPG